MKAAFIFNISFVKIGQIHNVTVENSFGRWTDLLFFISIITALRQQLRPCFDLINEYYFLHIELIQTTVFLYLLFYADMKFNIDWSKGKFHSHLIFLNACQCLLV